MEEQVQHAGNQPRQHCRINRDEHGACTISIMLAAASTQLSTSACGPTALLDVLHALNFTHMTAEQVLAQVPARLRDYSTPCLETYLLSRARAGTTHADLINGVEFLSSGKATGRLFSLHPLMTPQELVEQLAGWIAAGAVPLLTMNLFLEGQDAWHHQVVAGVTLPPGSAQPVLSSCHATSNETHTYGAVPDAAASYSTTSTEAQPAAGTAAAAGGSSSRLVEPVLHLLNPSSKKLALHILPSLTSPPFMIIPKDHVEQRLMQLALTEGITGVLALVRQLGAGPWASFDVGQQVMRIFMAVVGKDESNSDDEEDTEECGTQLASSTQPLKSAPQSSDTPLQGPTQVSPPQPQQRRASNLTRQAPMVQDSAVMEPIKVPGAAQQQQPQQQLPQTKKQQSAAYKGHTRFDDLTIPWGGVAGVTLFAREGSVAYAALAARPVRHVSLPLYDMATDVCTDMTPPGAGEDVLMQ